MTKNKGLLPSPQGIRDYDYFVVCGSSNEELPSSFQLPIDKYADVLNQYNYMACCGFSLATAQEYHHYKTLGEKVSYSPWYSYAHPENRLNYMGEGMYLRDAVKGTLKSGFVPLNLFDIEKEMPELYDYIVNRDDLTEIGKSNAPTAYMNLNYANKEKKIRAIKEALYYGGEPLIVASYKYFGGAHCILIYGWDDNKILVKYGKSDKVFNFRTSYGKEYRDNGNGDIPLSQLNEIYQFFFKDIEFKFQDVKQEDWFYNDVKKGVFSGLIEGVSAIEFKPHNSLIRGDMAVILDRTISKFDTILSSFLETQNQKGIKTSEIIFETSEDFKGKFYDISPDDYYYKSILTVCANNYMNGVGNNLFEPQRAISRAEFTTAIIRAYLDIITMLNKSMGKTLFIPNSNSVEFRDVPSNCWYTSCVKSAVALGIINGDGDGNFRPNDDITRAEATAVLNRFFRCVDKDLEKIR